MSSRPIPKADTITKFYWEGARREELRIQRCQSCRKWNHPPRERCPECGSSHLKGEEAPVKGEIYSYSITNQSRISGFEDEVPYIVATVKLEGIPVKIVCNLLKSKRKEIFIGMPVEIIFEHLENVSLPQAILSRS